MFREQFTVHSFGERKITETHPQKTAGWSAVDVPALRNSILLD